ncbi:MAG: DEAD/DEAH box helicase [Inquilinus sp.]|nr:DEAD/DEAH box helicase [Inquilinus sp.]
MSFSELGLKPEILRAVEDAGYTTPTPIQEQAIPYVLQGRDVLGIAQTGTGKTAGFTLPLIEVLSTGRAKARMPRSLILEPTRELAAQVAQNFETYGKYEKLTYALLIGGERFEEQIRKLDRGVDVLIATPGRMLDLFERGKVLLADVKILVIDEADRMLDMGFIPDIERIVGKLPVIRQTLFFSATMPPEIKRLTQAFLSNPKQIAVAPPATAAESVEQFLVKVGRADKRMALRHLLNSEDVKNALVFCNRKRDVGIVFRSLQRHGFDVGQLHGDMVQSVRTETLKNFKAGEVRILVCSDVAARGLDISGLSHVFNFDVPVHAEDYIHRIGRTGRAGASGRAFSIATADDGKFIAAIAKLVGMQIPVMELESFAATAEEETAEASESRDRRRGRRGERSGGRRGRAAPAAEESRAPVEAAVEVARVEVAPEAARVESPAAQRNEPSESGQRRRSNDKSRGEKPRGEKPRGEKPRGEKPRGDKPRGNARPGGREEAVIGLGDHTPAFLLRPVKRAATGG